MVAVFYARLVAPTPSEAAIAEKQRSRRLAVIELRSYLMPSVVKQKRAVRVVLGAKLYTP
jgi:hypothetical protein